MSEVSGAQVPDQLRTILRGVVDCVREADLRSRLEASLETGRPLRVKLGLDPTAPDLHLGHAVQLRKLRQFQDLGHEAILIVGGATAMLGDPSGKDKTRPQLSREDVDRNARTYMDQAQLILRSDRLTVLNNADWFMGFGFQDFLRLCSRMTVARMVERDLFSRRLKQGSPIGIHEFLYPLLQGWDSVEVKSDVEIGGTDQLFNLLVGRDFQEQEELAPQICLTLPIIVGLDGKMKMSKSLENYIGLGFEADDIYGKVMSLPDEAMESYFVLLTELDEEEMRRLLEGHPRDAKAELARLITAGLHGEEAAASAQEQFGRVFQERQQPDDVPLVQVDAGEAPDASLWVVRLVVLLGLARTNGEARRLIQGRGLRVDGRVVDDVDYKVALSQEVMVQAGKRRFVRARLRE